MPTANNSASKAVKPTASSSKTVAKKPASTKPAAKKPAATKKPATVVAPPAKKKGRARSWFAGITVAIAALLLPTAIVGNWATSQIVNTQNFVNTLAPLASNPAVQKTVSSAITNAIDNAIDINAVTREVVDGIGSALHLPPELQKLIDNMSGPIASGVQGLVNETVTKAVASPVFAQAFTKALTFTHAQVIALLSGDPNSKVQLDSDGTLSIPLGPLVEDVKQQLIDQKIPFAKMIPAINASVTIAKVPDLVSARVAYQIGVGVGMWLPWVVFLLFAASIALARKHWRQLMVSGIVTFVVAGVLGIGLSFGKIIMVSALSSSLAAASEAVYASIVNYVATLTVGLLIASVIAILVGVFFGLESTVSVRKWFNKGFARGRKSLDNLGVNTGAFGKFLHKHRTGVHIGIIAAMLVIAYFAGILNPVTLIAATLLGSGLLVTSEVLSRAK